MNIDEKEFNTLCAEFMGYGLTDSNYHPVGYMELEHCKKYVLNFYSDANDRNKVIEKMLLDKYDIRFSRHKGKIFVILDKWDKYNCIFHELLKELFNSLDEAQNACIWAVLKSTNE